MRVDRILRDIGAKLNTFDRRSKFWDALRTVMISRRLLRSGLFDATYYANLYARQMPEGMHPVRHYILFGVLNGCNPNPLFDTAYYLRSNPDVARARTWSNPLEHYLLHGAAEGRKPSPRFDTGYYLECNPQLVGSKINPLAHYLACLRTRGRVEAFVRPVCACQAGDGDVVLASDVHAPPGAQTQTTPCRGVVTFISPLRGTPSHDYRVKSAKESLVRLGFLAWSIDYREFVASQALVAFSDIVVLYRVGLKPDMEPVLEAAQKAGAVLVFDCDDDVFTAGVSDNPELVDGIRFLDAAARAGLGPETEAYGKALLACDHVMVSSADLAAKATALGKPATVVRNTFTSDFATQAATALAARGHRVSSDTVVVGYASGTLTHQKDFATIAGVLARLFRRYPNMRLVLVGSFLLAEFPELVPFSERIEQRPLVSHDRLPFELARFDVNLAPLEIGNPFCEAKSEIKYLEAALVGVPTVAAATDTYRAAIRQGETGLLAADAAQWEAALSRVIEDGGLRHRLGRAALAHVLLEYGPDAKDAVLGELFSSLLTARPKSAPMRPRSLTMVLPPIRSGGGGHGVALTLAKQVAIRGVPVHVCFTGAT